MGMKVHEVMTTRPRCVTPDTPVTEIAALMEADDVGAIPVVKEERLVGIVTDRDIVVRAIAKGKDPRGMPAADVSSSEELVAIGPDEDLHDALKLMAKYQVRRLPVVADDERLVGIVSQADVVKHAKEKDAADVLYGISREPSGPRTR